MKTLARSLAVLALTLCGLCLSAQQYTTQGLVKTPAQNSTVFVGAAPGFFSTIQSSVTFACAAGSKRIVDIPAGYTGSDTIAGVTGGCTTAWINDERVVARACYTWSGSAYTSTGCGSSAPPTGTQNRMLAFIGSPGGGTATAAATNHTTDAAGNDFGVPALGHLTAGTAFGSPTATGQGNVTSALSVCGSSASGCYVTIDPQYAGSDYQGLGNPSNYRNTALGYNTRLRDERHASLADFIAEVNGNQRVFGSINSLTPFTPLAVTLTRASNVVTVTSSSSLQSWCNPINPGITITVVNAATTAFNGTFVLTACTSTSLTYAQTGSNAATTGVITSHAQLDFGNEITMTGAGRGNGGIGLESQSTALDVYEFVTRKGINSTFSVGGSFNSTGDLQARGYDYIVYHQHALGNEDDENIYREGISFRELDYSPTWSITGVGAPGSTTTPSNSLYLSCISCSASAGAGHFLLFTTASNGTTSAAFDTGKITAIDPAMPSGQPFYTSGTTPNLRAVTINTTVAVSTAWGTFTNVSNPNTYDTPIVQTTTLTVTGGSSAPTAGWMCFANGERYERALVSSITGSGPYTITVALRNTFDGGNSGINSWMQGGMCNGPSGGGVAMKVNGLIYTSALNSAHSTDQVLPVLGSYDSSHVIYVLNENANTNSLMIDANNLLPESFSVTLTRNSSGVVTITGLPATVQENPTTQNPVNWCERTGVVISGATGSLSDLNGTITGAITCLASSTGLTYTKAGTAGTTAATATSDRNLSGVSFYAMDEVINTTDDSGQTADLTNFAQIAPTDYAPAIGQQVEDAVGGYVSVNERALFQTCYSGACNGEQRTYIGPGVRGQTGLNGDQFTGFTLGNSANPLQYQNFGGQYLLPSAAFRVGGPWQTIIDLNSVYHGGSGMAPGSVFLNVSCPFHPSGLYPANGPCQGPQDAWDLVDWLGPNGPGGVLSNRIVMNVPNNSLDFNTPLRTPTLIANTVTIPYGGSNGLSQLGNPSGGSLAANGGGLLLGAYNGSSAVYGMCFEPGDGVGIIATQAFAAAGNCTYLNVLAGANGFTGGAHFTGAFFGVGTGDPFQVNTTGDVTLHNLTLTGTIGSFSSGFATINGANFTAAISNGLSFGGNTCGYSDGIACAMDVYNSGGTRVGMAPGAGNSNWLYTSNSSASVNLGLVNYAGTSVTAWLTASASMLTVYTPTTGIVYAAQTTLSAGSATITLPGVYHSAPIFVCTDTATAATAVSCSVGLTGTTATLTVKGTSTDVISYLGPAMN